MNYKNFTNVGRDEEGMLIGNCTKCNCVGTDVENHMCEDSKSYLEIKQHISLEDWNQLTESQKQKIWDLWVPRDGDCIANMSAVNSPYIFTNHMYQPFDDKADWELMVSEKKPYLVWLPSIGQMLAILHQHHITIFLLDSKEGNFCDSIFKILKTSI